MARIRVERAIAADPASAALLLSGPAAADLWPRADARPVGPQLRVAMAPTSYVTRFEVTGDDLPETRGLLTLDYAGDGTHAVLRLDYEAPVTERLRVGSALREMAGAFLANLAAAAEDRSFAA